MLVVDACRDIVVFGFAVGIACGFAIAFTCLLVCLVCSDCERAVWVLRRCPGSHM